jgi:hypothetical protein
MTQQATAGRNTLTRQHLKALFSRVGSIIDAETRELKQNPRADLAVANARKNRCLHELNLVSRELMRFRGDREIMAGLKALGDKVSENEAALSAKIRATKDVISILGDAISNSESDGTYPSAARLPAGYE